MKRSNGTRLRDREGRSLSSYARNGKTPYKYEADLERSLPVGAEPEREWRKPRNTLKPNVTVPRSR